MKPPKVIRDASLPLNSDAARQTFHMGARPDPEMYLGGQYIGGLKDIQVEPAFQPLNMLV